MNANRTDHSRSDAPTPLVVGLTGLPSVGKGEVVSELLRLAADAGRSAEHVSFSDQIKEEAKERGLSVGEMDRDSISALARDMREADGPGVLAKRIVARVRERSAAGAAELFVVEALRHVAEAEILRAAFGERFLLVAVTAELDEIVRRMHARDRADESREAMQSSAQALELLRREHDGDRSDLGVNVSACIERADVMIENNASLAALKAKVGRLFRCRFLR